MCVATLTCPIAMPAPMPPPTIADTTLRCSEPNLGRVRGGMEGRRGGEFIYMSDSKEKMSGVAPPTDTPVSARVISSSLYVVVQ